MLNFQRKNSCKGHQRSNIEWHYIKKLMSPGVLFVWKFILASKTAQGWYYAALLLERFLKNKNKEGNFTKICSGTA